VSLNKSPINKLDAEENHIMMSFTTFIQQTLLYYYPYKLKKMRWIGRVEYMGETKNHTNSSHKT